jgi:hypothetical protein
MLHVLTHPDGNIWTVDVVESSGSHLLGMPASRSPKAGAPKVLPGSQARMVGGCAARDVAIGQNLRAVAPGQKLTPASLRCPAPGH